MRPLSWYAAMLGLILDLTEAVRRHKKNGGIATIVTRDVASGRSLKVRCSGH